MKNNANWYTPAVEHQMAMARLSELAWAPRPTINLRSLVWGTLATILIVAFALGLLAVGS